MTAIKMEYLKSLLCTRCVCLIVYYIHLNSLIAYNIWKDENLAKEELDKEINEAAVKEEDKKEVTDVVRNNNV